MHLASDDPALTAAATELSAQADLPAEVENQPGTFRLATKVWAGITLLSVVAIFVGSDGLEIFGGIFAVVGVICLLAFGINDLTVPRSRDRSTSDKAVHAYFKGMQKGRWDTAFASLAPYAREQAVAVPRILKLHTLPWSGTRGTKKNLKEYWRRIIAPHGGVNRRLAKIKLTPLGEAKDVHRHRVELQIQHYPSWVVVGILGGILPLLILVVITRKTFRTSFDVTTVKHKSQWWVLDGEFRAPLAPQDPALPAARVV